MIDINGKYRTIVESIKNKIPFEPEFAIVLGSGLGDFAEKVETITSIPTATIEGYPKSTVQGHQGYLHFSKYADKKLLIIQGRIHFYEGYRISDCVLPIHLAAKLKCKSILLTNAAGGINVNFHPGDLMMITSFNGMAIKKELTELLGITSIEKRNKFLDFPSAKMMEQIRFAASQEKIIIQEGTYWYTKGPSYETAAEIQMMKKFGGDAVGMSTFHEAVYAANQGLKVGAISCITNYAAGMSSSKLSHAEVMETAEMVKLNFEKLIKKIIELV
jgi:purine-nucleoside phosphorylase